MKLSEWDWLTGALAEALTSVGLRLPHALGIIVNAKCRVAKWVLLHNVSNALDNVMFTLVNVGEFGILGKQPHANLTFSGVNLAN